MSSGAYAIHCSACSDNGWVRCDVCDGRGELREEYGLNGTADRDPTCPACDGTGELECDCEPMGRPAEPVDGQPPANMSPAEHMARELGKRGGR